MNIAGAIRTENKKVWAERQPARRQIVTQNPLAVFSAGFEPQARPNSESASVEFEVDAQNHWRCTAKHRERRVSLVRWRTHGALSLATTLLMPLLGCTGDANITAFLQGTIQGGGPDTSTFPGGPVSGGGAGDGSTDNAFAWNFDAGDEGWTLLGGVFVDNTAPGWSAGGRKLSGSGEGPWYFVSPDSFSGDRSEIYGQQLQFSLSRDTSCRDRMPGEVWQGRIVLNGGGWSIGWGDISGSQHDFSNTVTVRLNESETWFVVSSSDPAVPVGSRATRGIFDEILRNFADLRIFGQRGYCDGTTTLDSVVIKP
ncbi:MAG: hypothetical protein H6819_05770 [Phycisphaerales bacterium]|nr:hypothetical protein [Phycisphaerales bacterium]MCB9858672.1 hypothetical protein [Phycisphaerales bacterium]MCB9864472.1 hypothetical protein [Phycisphaerales bacterium]